eukprot:748820-Hanusia_phi.AAC.5
MDSLAAYCAGLVPGSLRQAQALLVSYPRARPVPRAARSWRQRCDPAGPAGSGRRPSLICPSEGPLGLLPFQHVEGLKRFKVGAAGVGWAGPRYGRGAAARSPSEGRRRGSAAASVRSPRLVDSREAFEGA